MTKCTENQKVGREDKAQTNTLARKPQQQETAEANNDSRKAEHKLHEWHHLRQW